MSVMELFVSYGVLFDADIIARGDIVIWDKGPAGTSTRESCLEITEYGVPITTPVEFGKHFGVYEGEGLISDLVFDSDAYFPTIRVRKLCDILQPQRMLRLASLVEES